jgi:outer membrane protein assembly factor BamB
MSVRALLSAAAFVFAAAASAEPGKPGQYDWPRWRGPNNDDVQTEPGLLKKWPAGGPKVVWTGKNLGKGWGTPSVADGRVYGIGTRGEKEGVWALDEQSGKELWYTPFADPIAKHGPNTNGPASTPTFHNKRVYTVSDTGTLSCMDAASGKLVWQKNYVTDFGGAVPTWGYSDSVLIDDGKLICAPNGSKAGVAALKPDTGEVVWTTQVRSSRDGGYSSPVKGEVNGVKMYVVLLGSAGGIVGVHADTGKLLWQYTDSKTPGARPATGGTAQIPTPIVKGDKVWVSCSYNGGSALLQLIPAGDKFEVKELKAYKKPELNNHHGGMILIGNYIYFGHDQNKGYPACVDFRTGEIVWKMEKMPAGGNGSAAITCADGMLYWRYQTGVMVLAQPAAEEKKDGELNVVSSFKLPAANDKGFSQSWPHPVVANGKLYIRDQNVMYTYDVKAGGSKN